MFYTGHYLSKFNDGKLLLDRRFIKLGGDTNRNEELVQLVLTTGFEGTEFLNPVPLPKFRIGTKMARPSMERIFNIAIRLEKEAVFSNGESFMGRKIDFNKTLDGYFSIFEYFDACKEMGA